MQKPIKFRCWNCERVYTLNKQIPRDKYQVLRQPCPFCNKMNNLELYKFLKPVDTTLQTLDPEPSDVSALDFEQIFETEPDDPEQ